MQAVLISVQLAQLEIISAQKYPVFFIKNSHRLKWPPKITPAGVAVVATRLRPSMIGLTLLIILATTGLSLEISNLNVRPVEKVAQSRRPLPIASSPDIDSALKKLKTRTADFSFSESEHGLKLIDEQSLWQKLDDISADLATGQNQAATQKIQAYSRQLTGLNEHLDRQIDQKKSANAVLAATQATPSPTPTAADVPILLYHYTPADFDHQLDVLSTKGYATITMDNLNDYLHFGRPLPPKPVVITFDDGYTDQLRAFDALARHNMKATFYIITSGEATRWCIGVDRRYDQNPGCGDAYMNWDEISQLDHSGLIEIAAHTADHLNLPTLSPQLQQFQINQSKSSLETRLGHPIHHFAYPYGAFNQTTVELIKQSGFLTAVTTMPGSHHDLGSIFTLTRERDVYKLP